MIHNRGFYNLHDHWKSENHQLVEIQYRLAYGLPLLNRACKPAGAAECAKRKALVARLPPVTIESMFALSVEEMIAEATANEGPRLSSAVMSKSSGHKLWVCQSLDVFVSSTHFDSVVGNLGNLNETLLSEASFQHVLFDYALCQVSLCCLRLNVTTTSK